MWKRPTRNASARTFIYTIFLHLIFVYASGFHNIYKIAVSKTVIGRVKATPTKVK